MKIPNPIKYMEEKGMSITFLSKEEREAFIRATRPLYDKWIPKIGRDIYEKALADMGK